MHVRIPKNILANEVKKTVNLLHNNGGIFEIRILKNRLFKRNIQFAFHTHNIIHQWQHLVNMEIFTFIRLTPRR